MAIANRDLDVSEQRQVYQAGVPVTAIGVSTIVPLTLVPYPGTVSAVRIAAVGVSLTPVAHVAINRFVPGAGLTAILTGATIGLVNVGLSGPQVFTLPTLASTLLQVQLGDVVSLVLGPTGGNVLGIQAALVIKALQDIKQPLGLT